jgi:hypothetical protein
VSCLLFSFFYLLFLFISISFFDASTPVDSRILSPVFVLLIVGVFSAIWTVSQTLKKPMLWWCFFFFLILLIPIKIQDSLQSASTIHENGLGYTSKQTQDSESIAFIRSLDEDMQIYSNGEYVIDFLTERESHSLPERVSSVTMESNPRYNNEIKAICTDIIENRALLVYFKVNTWSLYLPTQEELGSICQIPVLQRFVDGTVYGEKY